METRSKISNQKMSNTLISEDKHIVHSTPNISTVKELTVDIDFDGASRAWTQNKQRRGASYYYLCGHILANGKDVCKNPAKRKKGSCTTSYCNIHS
jgi:hypothetical protein